MKNIKLIKAVKSLYQKEWYLAGLYYNKDGKYCVFCHKSSRYNEPKTGHEKHCPIVLVHKILEEK